MMIQLVHFEGQDYKSSTCHMRVRYARGPARAQACVDCGSPARDWSRRHGAHPMDPRNYDPRCRSCHWRYDGTVKNLAGAPHPYGERSGTAKLTDAQIQELRDRYAEGGISQEALGLNYGVVQSYVSALVRGANRTRRTVTSN